ncbi:MAG: diphosphomevalonate decarboxylase [Gammaproteobacteria bacterium]|nr:diphosphomevalonate decarboxylase [Gammaproteobacteria bacterium]
MQASAEAQPNIALVKYWGKRDRERNLPAVGSLSITLASLRTRMTVRFSDQPTDTLIVNGQEAPAMLGRVSRCLDLVAGRNRQRAAVTSDGNFPIGAGLASSASAFAALVVAADEAVHTGHDRLTLARMAGTASGSAARSLYGGFVELTAGDGGIGLTPLAAPADWPLEVVVAITEEGPKPVGSGDGMIRSAQTSPFYASWVERQEADLVVARTAVSNRDFASLAAVSEHNCLKMHSVMWTSRPPVVYWNEATIGCLEAIRLLQAKGVPVFFTIDAGPQVKAVCTADAVAGVRGALDATPGVLRTLVSGLGEGARLVPS